MAAAVHQTSLEPGATLTLTAVLSEYGAPFLGSGTVRVEVTRPDGSLVVVPLIAVGAEPGRFEAHRNATQAGIYRCRFLAAGRTSREAPFTREAIRTAALWHGGDQPGTGTFPGGSGPGGSGPGGSGPGGSGPGGSGPGGSGPGGSGPGGPEPGGWDPGAPGGHPGGYPGGGVPDWCGLLGCLLAEGVIGERLLGRLKEAGVDLERLRACLRALCTPREGCRPCGCGGEPRPPDKAELVRLLAQLARS
jgi:hypothetical protein